MNALTRIIDDRAELVRGRVYSFDVVGDRVRDLDDDEMGAVNDHVVVRFTNRGSAVCEGAEDTELLVGSDHFQGPDASVRILKRPTAAKDDGEWPGVRAYTKCAYTYIIPPTGWGWFNAVGYWLERGGDWDEAYSASAACVELTGPERLAAIKSLIAAAPDARAALEGK